MLRFFRQIRQRLLTDNKFRKYLLYAVGEILLVVVGILIALQVNNWNENRKEQIALRTYSSSLINDLKNNIWIAKMTMNQMSVGLEKIDMFLEYVRINSVNEFNNLDLFLMTKNGFRYRPSEWYKTTFNEMNSSGTINYIENDSLKLKLNNYYTLTEHLEQDYLNDYSRSDIAEQLLMDAINYNYANYYDIDSTLTLLKKPKEMRLQNPAYFQASLLDLKLLSMEPVLYNKIGNRLKIIQNALSIRLNDEYPRLISRAEELIVLIEREYNQLN
jgi:hypothetical protein